MPVGCHFLTDGVGVLEEAVHSTTLLQSWFHHGTLQRAQSRFLKFMPNETVQVWHTNGSHGFTSKCAQQGKLPLLPQTATSWSRLPKLRRRLRMAELQQLHRQVFRLPHLIVATDNAVELHPGSRKLCLLDHFQNILDHDHHQASSNSHGSLARNLRVGLAHSWTIEIQLNGRAQ